MLGVAALLSAVVVVFGLTEEDLPLFAANGETALVQAIDNAFAPVEQTIVAGTEMVWLNRGRNDHNIVPEDRDPTWLFEDDVFAPGDEVSYVFQTPGTYRYYCSIHGNLTTGMPGVVVVTAPS